jgi:hypothetical protein
MGWFEWLSGSNTREGARNASVAERIERKRYLAHHPPLRSDQVLGWRGSLLTGYHFHAVRRTASAEYINWPD